MCSGRHAGISTEGFADTHPSFSRRVGDGLRRWSPPMMSITLVHRIPIEPVLQYCRYRHAAAGNDHHPLTCPKRQCRIVKDRSSLVVPSGRIIFRTPGLVCWYSKFRSISPKKTRFGVRYRGAVVVHTSKNRDSSCSESTVPVSGIGDFGRG